MKEAKIAIKKFRKNLAAWLGWLDKNIKNKDIDMYQFYDWLASARSLVYIEPFIDVIPLILNRSINLSQQIKFLSNDVKSLYFNVLISDLDSLNPSWVNRYNQLDLISKKLIDTGERLISYEMHYKKNKFKNSDIKKITYLNKEHMDIVYEKINTMYPVEKWTNLDSFLRVESKLHGLTKKMLDAIGQFNTMYFVVKKEKFEGDILYEELVLLIRKFQLLESLISSNVDGFRNQRFKKYL